MRSFRVWDHGAPTAMRLEDLPTPTPGPGEILVAVRAVALNFPDLLVIGGTYQNLPPRPFTPGKDLAGVVLAVGPGVGGFRPGDRVMGLVEHGAFAEEVVLRSAHAFRIPDAMGFETAAAMGLVYQTAHFALIERAGLRAGETVLVGAAAGGVGLACVQIAKALGGRVLAGVRSGPGAAAAREAGADGIVDLSLPDLRENVRAQVQDQTGGHGADVVIDPLGGPFLSAALRSLAWCGRLVVVGFAAGEIPSVKVNYLLLKNIAISGLQWSDYRDRAPERVGQVQQELFSLWQAGKIGPRIMRRFAFESLPQGLELLAKGPVTGRIVVKVGPQAA